MTRPNSPLTSADCIAAIRLTGSFAAAARHLGIDQGQMRYRFNRDNINPGTLEPYPSIINGPAVSLDTQRATIKRALQLGIWHLDENGDIQTYRVGDPWQGNQPNLLDRPGPAIDSQDGVL